MSQNSSDSISQARTVVAQAQGAIDSALSHIKSLCMNESGRLSGSKLDEYQLVSYDLAYSSAELAAARVFCDFAENTTTTGELEEQLALMFCAEMVHNTKGRLAARRNEYGLSPEAFTTAFESQATQDFVQTYQQTSQLVDLGKLMLEQDGHTVDAQLDEDKQIMRESFQRFATDVVMPKAEHIHRDDLMIPDEILKPLVEMGCFGLSIPEEYDGLLVDGKEDNLGMIVVTEELSPHLKSDFYQPENLKIANNGVEVREVHKVVGKTSSSITFKEPIHRAVNASYGWQINSFKALEEVGVQDLKYTGGFTYKHIHHKAPEELYPNEAVSGPHAFMSSSGWSGIQFNHVVNGWIKNVEFTAMSQVAQFKFSANSTAFKNKYTGNPGHNYISTNSASGCFIGKNNDYTTGIWHGCGVNATSIGNVFWRNESPQTGTSGMEMHASQPRSTLFDFCKGGVFFQQGGSTGALPNHLKNMVLWNFEGVSYQSTKVKTFRPNSETKYAKFITPIISGLKGFTMSTEADQYQVNESPGKHVDEESLYEAQLKYRLGTLPSWINEGTSNPFHPIFYYEDFRLVNQGYSVYIDQNPDSQDENQIGKRISDIPDLSDSNNKFIETRPVNRIPANIERDQRALAIVGTSSNTNYKLEAWVLMPTINTTASNSYINNDDTYKYVSFWTEQRYANGGISKLEVYISTDYTDDVGSAYWTNVTSNVEQIATSGLNPQTYVESVLDISAYENTNFTLAFKYTSGNSAYSQTNRNGTFYISDVIFFVSDKTLSNKTFDLENDIKIYPNPFSSYIKIANLNTNYTNAFLFDNLGRIVISKNIKGLKKATIKTNFQNLSKGIYFLKLIGSKVSKKVKLIKS